MHVDQTEWKRKYNENYFSFCNKSLYQLLFNFNPNPGDVELYREQKKLNTEKYWAKNQ